MTYKVTRKSRTALSLTRNKPMEMVTIIPLDNKKYMTLKMFKEMFSPRNVLSEIAFTL